MSCIATFLRINGFVNTRNRCKSNHAIKLMCTVQKNRMFRISQDELLKTEGCHRLWTASQHLSWIRLYNTSPILSSVEKEISSKKKYYDSPLITLIDRDGKVSVLSLSQAQRLAKRRDLKLIKIEDATQRKDERPTYKLLSGKEYFEVQMSKKDNPEKDASGIKGVKSINMSGQIENHDLESKVNNVIKWIKKRQRVKVTISTGKSTEDARNQVMKKMEEGVAPVGGRLLQITEKGNSIKFYIEPPKVSAGEKESASQIPQSD